MNHILVGLLILSFSVLSHAESSAWGRFRDAPTVGPELLVAAKNLKPSAELLQKYSAESWTHFSIDLNQDGTPDHIVEHKKDSETCFVSADLKTSSCEKLNFSLSDGFGYEYFLRTGKNQGLILFDFTGDEDSSDYVVYRFDPKSFQRVRWGGFAPLIEVKGKTKPGFYHGYPWDIRNVVTKSKKSGVTIKAAQTANIPVDITEEASKHAPVGILFAGSPTQGDPYPESTQIKKELKDLSPEKLKKILSPDQK